MYRPQYRRERGARQAVEGDAADRVLRPRVRRGHRRRQPVRHRARRARRQPDRYGVTLVN